MTKKEPMEHLVKTINLTKADAIKVMTDARIKDWTEEQTINYAKSLLNK